MRAASFVVSGALVAATSLLFAPQAAADPGYCGVRDYSANGGMHYQYFVYNKCSRSITVKVWLPSVRRYARAPGGGTCQTVPSKKVRNFWDSYADRNWTIRSC